MKILQRRIFYLVNPFDLPDQQFRIADQLQRFRPMLNGVFKRRDQALILREVVGLVPKIFAELRDIFPSLIFNYNSVTSRTGITACPAVAVRN